jgi:hypothetical protein
LRNPNPRFRDWVWVRRHKRIVQLDAEVALSRDAS